MIVVWLLITMTQVCLQFVILVFPDNTHLLFYYVKNKTVLKFVVSAKLRLSYLY